MKLNYKNYKDTFKKLAMKSLDYDNVVYVSCSSNFVTLKVVSEMTYKKLFEELLDLELISNNYLEDHFDFEKEEYPDFTEEEYRDLILDYGIGYYKELFHKDEF